MLRALNLVIISLLLLDFHALYGNPEPLLKIAICSNDAPQSFLDEKGNPKGFTVDIVKAIMEELNYKYEFLTYNRRNQNYGRPLTIPDSLIAESDIITNCKYSDSLANFFNYSSSYNSIKFEILARQDSLYNGIHDLAKKEIIVKRGSASYAELMSMGRNYYNNIIFVQDIHTGVKLLHEGIADYMLCDNISTNTFNNIIYLNNLKRFDSGFDPLELYFLTPDKTITSAINVALLKLKMSGKYDEIYNRWFEVNVDNFNLKFLYWILLCGIIITLIFVIFFRIMRIQIKKAVSQSELYQKELSKNIYLLETIKNSMPVGLSFFDRDGYIKDINDSLCTYLCLNKEMILNARLNLFEMSHVPRYVKDALKDGQECRYELKYEDFKTKMSIFINYNDPLGDVFDVRCVSFRDKNGKIQGFITIFNDITEIIKDKQKIKLLEDSVDMALESGDLATWIYDCEEKVFSMIKGESLYEGVMTIDIFLMNLHPDDLDKCKNALNDIRLNISNKVTIDFRYKDKNNNKWRWFYCSMVSMPSNNNIIRYITGIRRDITADVESSMALENYNIELEKAKLKAEESERLKMAFLANMSHEIRTPLNAIVGFSEILFYSDNISEKEEYMNIIKINSELLLSIIDDILDLSKIESGMINIKSEKFDIVDIFNKNFLSFQSRCQNKDIQFICKSDLDELFVVLDHVRVGQVFANFLSNAIKYTQEGEIIVGLNYESEGVRFYVKDTGIGIDDDKKHMIFQRFEKLDSFAQGTGLGLAICKAIVSSLGGQIGFESEKNRGSLFWVWFPLIYKGKNEKVNIES